MRNEIKQKHSTVVINNPNGVCNKAYNCTQSVEAILPKGWTMDVWYPGASTPTVLTGSGPPVH
ncbi:hypothetical protein OHT76_43880 [Streptomyces sp. NBC_00287]|uniref:DddA-like double-stranded DNA deaminase toxin n=1 Tax=Streptomyces sp. NBC_00287 TaxID=2975702 RepID=UPI002E2D00FA|nr:DddA-like double-stranded DNA deaminase toxin [Streptomyces sp. NBC_00287]